MLPMRCYPVFVRLDRRPCVVIGGGAVAERKVDGLLRAGAEVAVVSPELSPRLAAIAERRDVRYHRRRYARGDLRGAVLAFAATGDDAVDAAVAEEAAAEGVLLNVADRPALCSFLVPAVVRRGELAVAVSTGGASPALSGWLRRRLERELGHEFAAMCDILAWLRRRLVADGCAAAERRQIFHALVQSPLLDHLRVGDRVAADRVLAETVGRGYTLDDIGPTS